MKASFLACGVAMALAAPHAHAANGKAQNVGAGSGIVIGALAGGPVGMVVGAGLGAWIGDKFADGRKLPAVAEARDAALDELDATQYELSSTRSTLARTEDRVRLLEDSLAERDQALAALMDARAPELGRGVELDVLFRTGESVLAADAERRLTELAGIVAASHQLRVQLNGHADPRGADTYNETLSGQRVQAVRDTLVAHGVDASRIEWSAHGERDSLAGEGDLDAYALERRVRIRLGLEPGAGDATAVADSK
jgi:outer membrane protein OmpA-like peptidoglycan-associated protein